MANLRPDKGRFSQTRHWQRPRAAPGCTLSLHRKMMPTSAKSNNGKAGKENEDRSDKDGDINPLPPAEYITRAVASRIMKAGQKAQGRRIWRYGAPWRYGNTGRICRKRNTSDKGCPNTGGGLKDGNGIAAEDTISALRRRDKKRGKE